MTTRLTPTPHFHSPSSSLPRPSLSSGATTISPPAMRRQLSINEPVATPSAPDPAMAPPPSPSATSSRGPLPSSRSVGQFVGLWVNSERSLSYPYAAHSRRGRAALQSHQRRLLGPNLSSLIASLALIQWLSAGVPFPRSSSSFACSPCSGTAPNRHCGQRHRRPTTISATMGGAHQQQWVFMQGTSSCQPRGVTLSFLQRSANLPDSFRPMTLTSYSDQLINLTRSRPMTLTPG